MTTTTAASALEHPTTLVGGTAWRVVLVAVLAVVLSIGAFALGRVTASESSTTPQVPTLSGAPATPAAADSPQGPIVFCHARVPC